MTLFLGCLALWAAGGLAGLFVGKRGVQVSAALAFIATALGIFSASTILAAGGRSDFHRAWSIPHGEFHLVLDPLSAAFLLPILALSALASIYAAGYLKDRSEGQLRQAIFFFHVLTISMCVVVTAKNAILFLLAWETMAISSFFLVMLDGHRSDVRRAGWMYLVATHIGTAFLLVLFAWMGHAAGSFDFDRWRNLPDVGTQTLAIWFILAVVGFGTKAGFWPFHVWLPEAHPAAPSHVSAVMSGVMIKTGIYGLIRIVTLLGPPPLWWGVVLLGIGLVSGILGVLFALTQHDIKRLLAYHSVENIGIIALGLGGWLLGTSCGMEEVALFGLTGAVLHVINHAMFKGLLFLGAGAVVHSTGTRDIERLGGLLKKMPVTGGTFLIGSAAISGLPPLNGFVSEFLIYAAFFKLAISSSAGGALGAAGVAGLALIGGLAAACFVKVFGVVFLGEPRTSVSDHPSPISMTAPMIALAAGCIFIGVFPAAAVRALTMPILETAGLVSMIATLTHVNIAIGALIGLLLVVSAIRLWILKNRPVTQTVTWDCGYAAPTPRMQYTASSFIQPFTDLFRSILQPKEHQSFPKGYFPGEASFDSHSEDLATRRGWAPIFEWIQWLAGNFQGIQQGRVQTYLFYIFLTLAAILAFVLFP